MLKSSLENPQEVNRALLGESKMQAGVKMYIQLPGRGDAQGFDLPNAMELVAISRSICVGFAKPSRLTLKRYLFNMRAPGNYVKAIRENATNDKGDGFKQERLFRWVGKIHISKTPIDLAEIGFADYGDGGAFLHIQDTFRDTT